MRIRHVTILLATVLLATGALWAQAQAPPQAQPQPQSWTGTLADAACKQADAQQKCPATATTTAYGLALSDGKFYKFDDAGNASTAKEMEKASGKSGEITATVTGTLEGDTIKVKSVQIQ